MKSKVRLDVLLVKKGLAESREQAKRLILSGKVHSSNSRLEKPGLEIDPDIEITVTQPEHPYVSRGGLKIAGALEAWKIDPTGWICADFGSSTGGFSDCLLQRGAAKIHAFDVGQGQLHWKLRQDTRIILHEGVNVRHLQPEDLSELQDLVCIDLSFISLVKVMESARAILKPEGIILALVKPQFEVGKGKVGKKGIIRRVEDRLEVLQNHARFINDLDLVVVDIIPSPILGTEGNMEYLSLIVPVKMLTGWRNRLGLPEENYPELKTLQRWAEGNRSDVEKPGGQSS